MSCGQEFSTEEIVMLIEKAEQTTQPICTPDKIEKKPPVEIKELPATKAKKSKQAHRRRSDVDTSATDRDTVHHDQSERD
jgi:hypothetical protein